LAEEEKKKEKVQHSEEKKPSPEVKSEDKKVSWVLALIMSIVFGQLGVDRFIMGQVGLGILKLLTGGGLGVWWLIDLILIATKHKFQGIEWVEN